MTYLFLEKGPSIITSQFTQKPRQEKNKIYLAIFDSEHNSSTELDLIQKVSVNKKSSHIHKKINKSKDIWIENIFFPSIVGSIYFIDRHQQVLLP